MKRSTAVALVAMGTLGVGGYAFHESRYCVPDGSGVRPWICRGSTSYNSSSSSGRSGFLAIGGSSSSTTTASSRPTGSQSTPSASRGGFGATGSGHASGS